MTVELVYRCDAPECPVTQVVSLDDPQPLATPDGWIVLGPCPAYYHACSPADAVLVAKTLVVRPVERRRTREHRQ